MEPRRFAGLRQRGWRRSLLLQWRTRPQCAQRGGEKWEARLRLPRRGRVRALHLLRERHLSTSFERLILFRLRLSHLNTNARRSQGIKYFALKELNTENNSYTKYFGRDVWELESVGRRQSYTCDSCKTFWWWRG